MGRRRPYGVHMTPSRLLTRPRPSPRRGTERGQASGEFAGILLVAGLLAGSLVVSATTWGEEISDGVICAIQSIGGEGAASCGTSGTSAEAPAEASAAPVDVRPNECTVRKTNEGYSTSINLGIVKIGEDQYFVATETLVRNADGTTTPKITVVVTDGASLGLEGGVGPKAELGNSSLGVEVKGSVGINAKYGDTWVFDSQADYDAFRQQWTDYEVQELQMQGEAAPGIALWKTLSDGWVDPPRSSDFSNRSFGGDASFQASLGAYLFGQKKADGSDDKPFSLNIGGYGKVKVSDSSLTTTDNRPGHEGESSTTYTFTGDANVGVNAVVVGGDVFDGTSAGAMKISSRKGPDGSTEVTSITFSTTRGGDIGWDPSVTNGPVGSGSGSGKVGSDDKAQNTTVTTTTITVTDQNRDVVTAWLAANSQESQGQDLALPTTVFEPTTPPEDPDDLFGRLLYDEAVVTKEQFETTDDNFNIGLSLAMGMKVGFDAGLTDEETAPTSAAYLQPPGPDGVRTFVDNTMCLP